MGYGEMRAGARTDIDSIGCHFGKTDIDEGHVLFGGGMPGCQHNGDKYYQEVFRILHLHNFCKWNY